MIELAVEFTGSFGPPEMAQMMDEVNGLIAFGMITSVLIGAALGLIIALFRLASADRDSGPGKHSGSAPACVNGTAALAAVAAALEAPTRANETAALAAVAAALEPPARPTSAGGYLVAVRSSFLPSSSVWRWSARKVWQMKPRKHEIHTFTAPTG